MAGKPPQPMTKHVLIAGSGKMGRNVGLAFVRSGMQVTWLSSERGRLEALERFISRRVKRMSAPKPAFSLVGTAEKPHGDVVFECVRESREDKRRVLSSVEANLVLSGSSSILPEQLHQRCLGAHFFYPLELTSVVELVCPENAEDARGKASELLGALGMRVIHQDRRTAFVANRLLLPLQNECFRAMSEGFAPQEVDNASEAIGLGLGQLSLMDDVGLDTICAAASCYCERMAPQVSLGYTPLRRGLRELVAAGKLGKKNSNGLLQGPQLPWLVEQKTAEERSQLESRLSAAFLNSCNLAITSELVTSTDLSMILVDLFGAALTCTELAAFGNDRASQKNLQGLFESTGLLYFRPAPSEKGAPFHI